MWKVLIHIVYRIYNPTTGPGGPDIREAPRKKALEQRH